MASPRPSASALHQLSDQRLGDLRGNAQRAVRERAAFGQNRFELIQRGEIFPLPEKADGNDVAPQVTFLHGGAKIRWVMAHVFKLPRTLFEKFVAVVVVVSHARAENVDKGEPFMLDTTLDQLHQVLLLPGETTRDVSGPRGYRQRDRVDRVFDAAKRSAFGLHPFSAGGRELPGRQAVNLVIHDNVSDIDVAAHGMDKVVAADAKTVPVAAGSDDFELVVGHLGAG